MNDIQDKLIGLQDKGWTLAAIADELGLTASTIERWKAGTRYPGSPKPILMALDGLAERRRIPKRRRYEGTHHLQRKKTESGE